MGERNLREERREQRRALSRDQIMDVAEQVFARNGFHDASLREIAELAEYSVGAVYGFFASRTSSTAAGHRGAPGRPARGQRARSTPSSTAPGNTA
jgi:AcrR family transcriptional regulator